MKTAIRAASAVFLLAILLQAAAGQEHDLKKNLLLKKAPNGRLRNIKNAGDWYRHREQLLDSMKAVMGPMPGKSHVAAPDMQILSEEIIGNVRIMKISFVPEPGDRVPAYLLIPLGAGKGIPGILCLHQTTSIGKAEPAGFGGSKNLHYALELAQRGYVTLAPDYPNFGDYIFDPYTHGYISATMKGIWNHRAALTLLQSLPQVDSARLGCIGHSLGGHNSLFLAAFDKRVKAVVTSCGFNSFYKYYGGDLTGWSHRGYMPLIASKYGKDPARIPFDFTTVLGAIAPRAVFVNAPLGDSNFEISGVRDCINAAKPVYSLLRAEGKLVMVSPDAPHDFPPEAREAAYRFLDRELGFIPK